MNHKIFLIKKQLCQCLVSECMERKSLDIICPAFDNNEKYEMYLIMACSPRTCGVFSTSCKFGGNGSPTWFEINSDRKLKPRYIVFKNKKSF